MRIVPVLALAFAFLAGWVFQKRVHSRNVRKPLLIQYSVTGADGKLSLQLTQAVRSDGATVQETLPLVRNGGFPGVRHIALPAQKRSVTLDIAAKTKLEARLSDQRIADMTGAIPGSCEEVFKLPREGASVTCEPVEGELLGRKVVRVRQTVGSGDGALQRELLAAPGLEWCPLQITAFHEGRIVEVRKAVFVQEGEPDKALFEIPAEYSAVGLPSQLMQRSAEARGRQLDVRPLPQLDEAFRARQGSGPR